MWKNSLKAFQRYCIHTSENVLCEFTVTLTFDHQNHISSSISTSEYLYPILRKFPQGILETSRSRECLRRRGIKKPDIFKGLIFTNVCTLVQIQTQSSGFKSAFIRRLLGLGGGIHAPECTSSSHTSFQRTKHETQHWSYRTSRCEV